MDKKSEKITKDPKRVEAGCKGRENYMNKYKDSILNDAKKGSGDATNTSNETTSPTNSPSNETTSPINNASNGTTSANNTTLRLNDSYAYGIGILAVLAIGVCVFFTYNTFQPKKLINDHLVAQHEQNQPPKYVICFRKIYTINELSL